MVLTIRGHASDSEYVEHEEDVVSDVHEMTTEKDLAEEIVMRCTSPGCARQVAIRSSDVIVVIERGNERAFHRYTYGQTLDGGVMQPVDALA